MKLSHNIRVCMYLHTYILFTISILFRMGGALWSTVEGAVWGAVEESV